MQQWNNRTDTERELDLTRIGQVLLKRAWLIVAVAVLFGVATYIYSALFITPKYRSYFTAYVNNRLTTEAGVNPGINTSTGDLTASMGLVYVYQSIITSRSVLEPAAEACGVPYAQIGGSVSASVAENAPVLTVVVDSPSPKLSMEMAQKIAELAPAKVAEVVDGSSMRIIDEPTAFRNAVSPNKARNAMIGAAFGLLVTALFCVVSDLVYDDVQNSADLERRYNIPVIGRIPDMVQAEKTGDRYGYRKAGTERK